MRRLLTCMVLAACAVTTGPVWAAPGNALVARTFHLRYRPVDEAAQLAQSLLSGNGNLTVYPAKKALTVQDTPSVLDLVAHVFREYDRPDPVFRVRATLLEASNEEGNGTSGVPDDVDPRVRRMFPFKAYRKLGTAVLEWDAPGPISATLGEGFVLEGQAAWSRLRTGAPAPSGGEGDTPSVTARDLRTAWELGGKDMVVSMLRHRRLVIEDLTLSHAGDREGKSPNELLRTRVVLAPNQEVVLAMSPSEDAERAVIIVLKALTPHRRVEAR